MYLRKVLKDLSQFAMFPLQSSELVIKCRYSGIKLFQKYKLRLKYILSPSASSVARDSHLVTSITVSPPDSDMISFHFSIIYVKEASEKGPYFIERTCCAAFLNRGVKFCNALKWKAGVIMRR